MSEERDLRENALADLDLALEKLSAVADVELVIRPRGSTEGQTVYWLGREAGALAKRELARQHLKRLDEWATILISEDGNRRRATELHWPGPPGLPFPEPRKVEPCLIRRDEDEPEDAAQEEEFTGYQTPPVRQGSRYSEPVMLAVLTLWREVEARFTKEQIVEALSSRVSSVSVLNHTLAEAVRVGLLSNCRDNLGRGYFPTDAGRKLLDYSTSE